MNGMHTVNMRDENLSDLRFDVACCVFCSVHVKHRMRSQTNQPAEVCMQVFTEQCMKQPRQSSTSAGMMPSWTLLVQAACIPGQIVIMSTNVHAAVVLRLQAVMQPE